jgi:hypothetical protein
VGLCAFNYQLETKVNKHQNNQGGFGRQYQSGFIT